MFLLGRGNCKTQFRAMRLHLCLDRNKSFDHQDITTEVKDKNLRITKLGLCVIRGKPVEWHFPHDHHRHDHGACPLDRTGGG